MTPLLRLVMSAAAPTSNSHLHTDRWPFWQAIHMGVTPLFSALVMSAAAPTSNSHLHTDSWPFWQAIHMEHAVVIRLGDVRGRAHSKSHLHTDNWPISHARAIGHILFLLM